MLLNVLEEVAVFWKGQALADTEANRFLIEKLAYPRTVSIGSEILLLSHLLVTYVDQRRARHQEMEGKPRNVIRAYETLLRISKDCPMSIPEAQVYPISPYWSVSPFKLQLYQAYTTRVPLNLEFLRYSSSSETFLRL